jgi:cobalt/nickel transport system ATP-binding protein
VSAVNPLVHVRDLRYTFDNGVCALNGIHFELEANRTVALLGPNGSGKTTFALHLNGILRGSGYVAIGGLEVKDANLTEIRRRVGIVFQDSDSQLFMPTVLEDVAFGPAVRGHPPAEANERAREALHLAGITALADRAPWQLSAGEKKRTALAGVLACEPELLVLDEPTTFLDPPGQRDFSRLLADLPQAKIIISHDVAFVRRLTEEAVFFWEGTIAARGPLAEIVQHYDWEVNQGPDDVSRRC